MSYNVLGVPACVLSVKQHDDWMKLFQTKKTPIQVLTEFDAATIGNNNVRHTAMKTVMSKRQKKRRSNENVKEILFSYVIFYIYTNIHKICY
jgi:hypothetical protein